MIENIKTNLGDPEMLEKLYHNDKKNFKAAFDKLYPDIAGTDIAKVWKARLDYDNRPELMKTISFSEIVIVVAVCVITSFLVKIPALFKLGYSEEIFYMKNIAIIVFFGLTLYLIWIKGLYERSRILVTGLVFLFITLYINLLPSVGSDQLNLVYMHLPLLMWFIYGIAFTGYDFKDPGKRIDFIRYNGDMAVVYALIAIAGGILTFITIGLFQSIGLKIEEFYFKNIVLTGAVAAPVVASYLIEKFPALVSKTVSLIAVIFSPLVLFTLLIFLVSMAVTGKDPYNDRDFLLVFNVLLLGVMGIIIFSVSETPVLKSQKVNSLVLFALSIVTIIIDVIALSAIFYRLKEYGLTPNRLAVLVSNILVLANLVLIMAGLFKINFKHKEFSAVEMTISRYLPVYLFWILVVVFGFPVIFGLH